MWVNSYPRNAVEKDKDKNPDGKLKDYTKMFLNGLPEFVSSFRVVWGVFGEEKLLGGTFRSAKAIYVCSFLMRLNEGKGRFYRMFTGRKSCALEWERVVKSFEGEMEDSAFGHEFQFISNFRV